MTDVDLQFGRVRAVLERPTLRLMTRPTAAAVIAVFRAVFERDVQYVPAERMHLQVDEHIARLARAGARVPAAAEVGENEGPIGRALCREWVAAQWLVRSNSPDGDEQYSLTSHALEAMSLIDALAADRALISESRLTMIVDAVHRWAQQATPDREARLRHLDAQIAELTAERQRVAAGAELVAADDQRMRDGYANLVDLIRQLPGDFKRVEEALEAMHRTIVEAFRTDARPIAEVLDDYLLRTDRLMESTPEGRAFEGAFELLRDDALLAQLRDDITTILEHPFAAALSAAERRAFRNTVAILRQGVEDVLVQRRRLTATLRDQIVAHDVIADRELDAVLRSINRRLADWNAAGSSRRRIPLTLLPAATATPHLRERLYDTDADAVPPPIDDLDDDDMYLEPVDVDSLRQFGGPLLDVLRAALEGSAPSSATAFNDLPDPERRPVELFGLAHLLTGLDDFERGDELAPHLTVRPDGTVVTFDMPSANLQKGTR
ncbi:DUF3375 family protein [Curtobacterium ammoniigenes]|uniref:DUF3375 family protein n=1 Tax=Curtobacterium ammoniigenes TaxID=395387 RepID=UPI0008341726|nr:DUF3375 family protein [Curtobacterium ammoniigenes]